MTYYVRAPGTCGEFLQGSINGQSFLVTCPINRYSYALSNVTHPFSQHYCALQPKSAKARQLVQRLLQKNNNYKEPLGKELLKHSRIRCDSSR